MTIFYNSQNIPHSIIKARILAIDLDADIIFIRTTNDEGQSIELIDVHSSADPYQFDAAINAVLTMQESDQNADYLTNRSTIRSEYVATIQTLTDIENAVSPTNAQVIAAVKFLAKTLRFTLKFIKQAFIG